MLKAVIGILALGAAGGAVSLAGVDPTLTMVASLVEMATKGASGVTLLILTLVSIQIRHLVNLGKRIQSIQKEVHKNREDIRIIRIVLSTTKLSQSAEALLKHFDKEKSND